MSTTNLQSAINILAEKETESNWTKKKDALDTIYTYAQNQPLSPPLQRQLLPSLLSVLATERSTLACSVSSFLSSLAHLPHPNEASTVNPSPSVTGKFTVLFSEPLFTKLIELSQRKSSGVLARTTMRALLDILYYAPPSTPSTTILTAMAKCITKGGIVEHHTMCRELCCRIINQILTIWPVFLWNKISYSNEDDIFITVLLLLLCDKDELIRRLARVNYRLFLARVNNPLMVRNFRNNDPSFASHMAKVFDENECNKDVTAITRLNQTILSQSTNSNNTDSLPPFLLEFESSAEVVVSTTESIDQTLDTGNGGTNDGVQQENSLVTYSSNNDTPTPIPPKSTKKGGILNPSSSITTNTNNNVTDNTFFTSKDTNISHQHHPMGSMNTNPYCNELSLPLGSIVYSFAAHTKLTLHTTMNNIHQLLPTLANLDKRVAAARMKHVTDSSTNPLAIATQILNESSTPSSSSSSSSKSFLSSNTSVNSSTTIPCIENTNIHELQTLAAQTQELINTLSASLPQLQNHLEIIQERIQRGE